MYWEEREYFLLILFDCLWFLLRFTLLQGVKSQEKLTEERKDHPGYLYPFGRVLTFVNAFSSFSLAALFALICTSKYTVLWLKGLCFFILNSFPRMLSFFLRSLVCKDGEGDKWQCFHGQCRGVGEDQAWWWGQDGVGVWNGSSRQQQIENEYRQFISTTRDVGWLGSGGPCCWGQDMGEE